MWADVDTSFFENIHPKAQRRNCLSLKLFFSAHKTSIHPHVQLQRMLWYNLMYSSIAMLIWMIKTETELFQQSLHMQLFIIISIIICLSVIYFSDWAVDSVNKNHLENAFTWKGSPSTEDLYRSCATQTLDRQTVHLQGRHLRLKSWEDERTNHCHSPLKWLPRVHSVCIQIREHASEAITVPSGFLKSLIIWKYDAGEAAR